MTFAFGQGENILDKVRRDFCFGAQCPKRSFQTMTRGVSFVERDNHVLLWGVFSCPVIKPQWQQT